MKYDILAKIRKELLNRYETERQVVYLLVEVRKLLDLTRAKDDYETLVFFCDWAVHVRMDRKVAKSVVSLFNDYQRERTRLESNPGGLFAPIDEKLQQQVSELYDLRGFRVELDRFLRSHNLPNDITRDQSAWRDFVGLYLTVIQDCPLKGRANLDYVRSVKVTVIERVDMTQADLMGYHVKFSWEWSSHQTCEYRRHISTF